MENIQDLKSQLAQLEAQCKALEEQLRQAKELAVQKQFEVTKLNHAGFFSGVSAISARKRTPPGQNIATLSLRQMS